MSTLKTLTVNDKTYKVVPIVPTASVTLLAAGWVGSERSYSQKVKLDGVTPNTKVDLQPTPEQDAIFYHKALAFVAENDGGAVTVYSIGDKPQNDYTIQVTMTEVVHEGPIRGNTVGLPNPQADWNQTDPTKADYIKNKPSALDGKSAYEYAKDGGYTGTEAEFAEKLASGGSGIHIDPEPPTDPNIKVWIDTDEEAEVPGGVTSWKDLPDKPFYSEMVDPTFDGDMTDREKVLADPSTGAYAVKITPQSVAVNELIGATLVLDMGGTEQTITITAEMAMDSNPVLGVPGSVVLQGSDPIVLSLPSDINIMGADFTAGTWFMCIPGYFYVKSLSCLAPVEIIHKMDAKFIDAEWMATKEEKTELVLPIGEYGYEEWIETNNSPVVGDDYIVSFNGVEYVCTCVKFTYKHDNSEYASLGIGNLKVYNDAYAPVIGEFVDNGMPFFVEYTDGFYIPYTTNSEETFALGITHKCGVTKLPDAYLPETALRKKDYLNARTHWTDEDGTVHKLDNKYIDAEWMAVKQEQIKETELFNISMNVTSATAAYGLTSKHEISKSDVPLKVGDTVKVLFDGVEYICPVKVGGSSQVTLWFGDGSIKDSMTGTTESTGEPFLYVERKAYDEPLIYGMPVGNHTMKLSAYLAQAFPVPIPEEFLPESLSGVIIRSSTAGSTKKFQLTVDDSGTISATEVS